MLVYGVAHSDPSVCSPALTARSGGLFVTSFYRKLSLGCMVFDLFHAKQNVLQWYEIKRSCGFFFFQSALYCKLLQSPVLFSSGYVRKIPGSEITSFLLSSSIGHTVEVGISDCLWVFNVMVTSKSPKGSLEGGFNAGVKKCQC